MRGSSALLLAAVLAVGAVPASAAERQIFVCASAQASAPLRAAAADLAAHIGEVPLFAALRAGHDAGAAAARGSDEFLAPKAYDEAAHNHLVVVGLRSQDPLLDKVWGFNAAIDEEKRLFYSLGWGWMQGDIGWVESDRNPFLHSRKISSAPEDTVTVKITGTTEAGVLAALQAFRGGLLNGVVAAGGGAVARPRTTLLDRDPSGDPAPFSLPAEVTVAEGQAALAGWNEPPESEYRAVLEAGGILPERMWRYKYLAPGALEQIPIMQFFNGVNARSMGNAVDLIRFKSDADALAAARAAATASKFAELRQAGLAAAWQADWIFDNSESITKSFGKTVVAAAGPWMIVSSLPPEAVAQIAASAR